MVTLRLTNVDVFTCRAQPHEGAHFPKLAQLASKVNYVALIVNGLFKYFSTDHYRLAKLANHQILLTPPKYFNDPWDFLVQREPATAVEIRTLFEEFEKERAARETDVGLLLPASFLEQAKEERFTQFKAAVTRPEYLEKEGPQMQDGLSKLFGVVSLTGDPLNRLMWARYADAHRGVAVEFAYVNETEVQGFRVVGSPFGLALKVMYGPKLSKLRPDFSNA